eukprot:CAMPEP_0181326902 /NCGR_PEP_ID=MMETSP1101-20121128/21777_1 /TAXON_ID=46948 /ORGANISM="Rhodomonas abbreviata, Strain Caron Lab Isolate" /LENGTH=581 /DNA_ID=CAMNT_0023435449 /DNA_START=9 /DNA_END=1754 /DNA_ORIENTATION=+
MVSSSQHLYGSTPEANLGEPRSSSRNMRQYQAVAGVVALSCCVIAAVMLTQGPSATFELESAAAQKALSLEMSKRSYDAAKERVKKLHTEFASLKAQLHDQMQTLDSARGNLVSQIKQVEGSPDLDAGEARSSFSGLSSGSEVTAPFVTHLRDAASALAAAGTSNDAADAAKHALSYTQQVASRVGDLADESEKQAERIVDAARLTHEAKDAMRAALEQSSQIVDYNTHAAQAVAQDSGFVTTAAQTISGYLHNIFHDSQAVHQAAIMAVKHMNGDVTAADHAVDEIESDAKEAYDLLEHIHKSDEAATGFASHARAAATTAATAAQGALKGERAAMVGGLKAIASAHSAKAGAQAAMEYARAAQAAVHPYVYGEAPKDWGTLEPAAPEEHEEPEGGDAPVAEAKELVDAVVVLMQQLTNALETSGEDCDKVRQILTYYQAQMARYHMEGQGLAGKLTTEDMELVEQYAQTQVASFASALENVVRTSSSTCSLPISAFIPDASIGMEEPEEDSAEMKIKNMKTELSKLKVAKAKKAAEAKHKGAKGTVLDHAVQAEQSRVKQLKAQVQQLEAEKAKLSKKH